MNIDDCKNHEASDRAKTKRQQILSPNHHLEHNVEIETGCIWTCNYDCSENAVVENDVEIQLPFCDVLEH